MTSSLSDLYLQRLARKQHIAALLHTDPDDPNDSCNQNEWISSLMYPNQIKEAIIEGSGGDAAGSTAEEGAHNLRRHNFHTRREKRSRQQQDDSGETAPASAVAAPGALLATKKVSPILQIAALSTTPSSSSILNSSNSSQLRRSHNGDSESIPAAGDDDNEEPFGGADQDVLLLVRSYQKRCQWIEDHRRRGTFQWQTPQERVSAEFKEMLKRRQQFSRTRKNASQ